MLKGCTDTAVQRNRKAPRHNDPEQPRGRRGGRNGVVFSALVCEIFKPNQTLRGLLRRYPTALGAPRGLGDNTAPGAAPLPARSGCSRFCVRPRAPHTPGSSGLGDPTHSESPKGTVAANPQAEEGRYGAFWLRGEREKKKKISFAICSVRHREAVGDGAGQREERPRGSGELGRALLGAAGHGGRFVDEGRFAGFVPGLQPGPAANLPPLVDEDGCSEAGKSRAPVRSCAPSCCLSPLLRRDLRLSTFESRSGALS